MNSWLIAIALAGILIATARFLDKYHPKEVGTDWLRAVFIKIYLWLDDFKLPDLAGGLTSVIISTIRKLRWVGLPLAILSIYVLLTTFFYLSRLAEGNPPAESYFQYITLWLYDEKFWYYLLFLLWIIFFCLLSLYLLGSSMRVISSTDRLPRQILFAFTGVVLVVLCGLVSGVGTLYLFGGGGYGTMALFAIVASSAPAFILGIIILTLTISRSLVIFLRVFLQHFSSGASDPANKPLSYVADFCGVLVLVTKLSYDTIIKSVS